MANNGSVTSVTTYATRLDPYVSAVVEMAEDVLRSEPFEKLSRHLPDVLDGQAAAKLRDIVPLTVRRETGAFFSSSELRGSALTPWNNDLGIEGPILDPAIGAGDLVLEIAKHLPIDEDLPRTLRQWGKVLHGRDIEPRFVKLAKARLVILAAALGAKSTGHNRLRIDEVLPEIKVGDGLSLLDRGWPGGHIVMNPPYTYREAPDHVGWTKGRTNVAALFLSSAVNSAQSGTRVTAILPDVVRTGSRYARLRSLLESQMKIHSVHPYGRFDAWTDIDVFVLRGLVADHATTASPTNWWPKETGKSVSDLFDVSIGPVVPHRQTESESPKPYLDSRTIPIGGNFDASKAERKGFNNRLVEPSLRSCTEDFATRRQV